MKFEITPIGYVENERAFPLDDNWGEIISKIQLNDDVPAESLIGLEKFSHLEILYLFSQTVKNSFSWASHPRGNINYPLVGIFSQRKKERPNSIGLCTVELISVEEKILKVKNLDAINGTPIIDIKPVFKEFEPHKPIIQPDWVSDLMKEYW
ncbi:MAG: tRNA (N6-threonylcarbamoyladenosine(37)-N6)-methyltransferase TrmO [Cytophagales bacterium]